MPCAVYEVFFKPKQQLRQNADLRWSSWLKQPTPTPEYYCSAGTCVSCPSASPCPSKVRYLQPDCLGQCVGPHTVDDDDDDEVPPRHLEDAQPAGDSYRAGSYPFHCTPASVPAQTTAYTGLVELLPPPSDTTSRLVVVYDRLANGWEHPPGRWGDEDAIFSMVVSVTARP